MKKFAFANPEVEGNDVQNWKHLIDRTQAQEWNPFLTVTYAAAGWDAGALVNATYYTFGPLVHFSISFGNVGWTTGAYIIMPFRMATRGAGAGTGVIQWGAAFDVMADGYYVAVDSMILRDSGTVTTLSMQRNDTGAFAMMNVSGWYFRD